MTNNVFITGGSRGIGAAAVLAFARAGYNVAFTYNSHPDAADAVRRQTEEINPGGLYLAIRADAGDPAQVRAAVARAEQEFGSLQVLVCNAGIAQVKLFTDTTDEDWRRMMAVDLDGAFYACRAVLPGMIHRKYGRILLVSSMWGQTGGSCEVAYSAAKAGLIGLGKALAKEEGPSGITVNVIAPGVINTDMMAGLPTRTAPRWRRRPLWSALVSRTRSPARWSFSPTRPAATSRGRCSVSTAGW